MRDSSSKSDKQSSDVTASCSHYWTLSSSPTAPHPPLQLARQPNRRYRIGGAGPPPVVHVYGSFCREWVQRFHPRQQGSRSTNPLIHKKNCVPSGQVSRVVVFPCAENGGAACVYFCCDMRTKNTGVYRPGSPARQDLRSAATARTCAS